MQKYVNTLRQYNDVFSPRCIMAMKRLSHFSPEDFRNAGLDILEICAFRNRAICARIYFTIYVALIMIPAFFIVLPFLIAELMYWALGIEYEGSAF